MATVGVGVAAVVLLLVWIWAVVDIARHDVMTTGYKIFWILFTLVLPLLGTFIWIAFRPPRGDAGPGSSGYFSPDTNLENL